MKQIATHLNPRISSICWRSFFVMTVASTLASPAQAASPYRAIFTGSVVDNEELFYPTGLSPSDTFTWAVVFNKNPSVSATQVDNQFNWEQDGPDVQPLFDPETLTSPFNTGITGTAYNSISTFPTATDRFQLNNSTKEFILQTGRLESDLTVELDGTTRTLTNLSIDGVMPGLGPGTSSNLYTFLTEAVGPSGQYSCSALDPGCSGTGSFELGEEFFSFGITAITLETLEVPGPIGIAGLAPLVAYSRKLKRNIKASRSSR